MKVLLINGSPRANGNTALGLKEMQCIFEAEADKEGLQTMRKIARNMTFLMKSIALGKEQYGLPAREKFERTNFIGNK